MRPTPPPSPIAPKVRPTPALLGAPTPPHRRLLCSKKCLLACFLLFVLCGGGGGGGGGQASSLLTIANLERFWGKRMFKRKGWAAAFDEQVASIRLCRCWFICFHSSLWCIVVNYCFCKAAEKKRKYPFFGSLSGTKKDKKDPHKKKKSRSKKKRGQGLLPLLDHDAGQAAGQDGQDAGQDAGQDGQDAGQGDGASEDGQADTPTHKYRYMYIHTYK